MCPFLNDMMQIIQLKGKDKHLYRLLAPLVMDPEVIRANNNYPFKTGEEYVWFIAIEDKEVMGFVPVEQTEREELLSLLLPAVIAEFGSETWLLNSVTLIQDKEIFEKFEFVSMDKKWTRYVKMYR